MRLLADAPTLKDQEGQQLTTAWAPSAQARDVSGPRPLSCAAFLEYTSELPTAAMPDVVQLMWLHLEVPAPDDAVTIADQAGGCRVWCRLPIRDVSGSVEVGVSENCSLSDAVRWQG